MPYGIGGGGQMGFALEVLAPPVQAALATAASGGTIAAGTYRYVVTAINANGETIASNEQTIVTSGATSTVTVTWATVTGATGFRLYKTAAGGATGTELFYKAVGLVTSDIDTAPGSPVGAFPLINTASNPGVAVVPSKFFPFNSESLQFQQATVWRRPIRQSVGVVGAVPGNSYAGGDIEMEALEDVIPYFMRISRMTLVRTGTAPNYIYTGTPNALAIPTVTATITIERTGGQVFVYTGCIVSSFKFGISDGMLTYNISILARDEATGAIPVPTWPTTTPFGAGQYIIEFPVGTTVNDTDTFEFSTEDNGEPQFRLKNTGRGADFFKYGERNNTLTAERDFLTRTDYDAFKALTSQIVRITATKGANNQILVDIPVAIKDTYEVGLSSQGDLVRARIQYQNIINATGAEYTLTVKTQELVS